MQITKLPIPNPGELEVCRGFRTAEQMGEVNAAARLERANGYIFSYCSRNLVEELISGDTRPTTIPEPFVNLTHAVVEALDYDWRQADLYVRHMGGDKGVRSVSIHTDNSHDIRVLVEGDGATWEFDQPQLLEEYPEGLQLQTGDVTILNNKCEMDEQLRHGVRLALNQEVRTSYLFSFRT